MPNHFHGIMIINDSRRGLVSKPALEPLNIPFYHQKTKLGKIIAYFKYETTKLINKRRDSAGLKIWQSNYYEHIIRSQKSLEILQNYIIENPLRWSTDQLHPDHFSRY